VRRPSSTDPSLVGLKEEVECVWMSYRAIHHRPARKVTGPIHILQPKKSRIMPLRTDTYQDARSIPSLKTGASSEDRMMLVLQYCVVLPLGDTVTEDEDQFGV